MGGGNPKTLSVDGQRVTAKRYPRLALTSDELWRMTPAAVVALGADFAPDPLRERMLAVSADLSRDQNPVAAISRRDELIRAHDQRFNGQDLSRTRRAKTIAQDLKRAAALTSNPADLRLVSARIVLAENAGKPLSYRRLIEIIQ